MSKTKLLDGRPRGLPKPTALDLENALATYFDYRRVVMVPNVSWGWSLPYEADLVVVRQSRWAEEIEIKVTASDIRADTKKRRHHDSPRFRRLWFCVPENLVGHPDIPKRAGVLVYGRQPHYYRDRPTEVSWWQTTISVGRPAAINPDARQLEDREYMKLLQLGVLRVWSLKQHALSALNDRRAKEKS